MVGGRRAAVLTALALSLLNPHVYLDTVVLLGGVAARYPAGERLAFALGAMLASCLWFYGLGYGARRLAPLFARSEEHTSELQSLMRISYAVFCLKKKKTLQKYHTQHSHINTTQDR